MISPKQFLMSRILFPLYHIVRNDGLLAAASYLEKSQWNTRAELATLQDIKLVKLLEHCKLHVPYYRKFFTGKNENVTKSSCREVFASIPFLTKADINRHQVELLASNFSEKQIVRNTTGGSTGESLVFYNDKHSLLQRQAVVLRNQKWVGALYADREVRLWGAQMDIDRLKGWRSRLHSLLNSNVHLSTYDLSDDSMLEYVQIINRFRPKLLISYPSPLVEFSKFIIDNKIQIHHINSIITSAEKLYDWQRDVINEAFHSEIYDRYGCREFGNIAHECDHHEGYHVNDERFIIEVLDNDGIPVKEGETGRLYITDLDNFSFPFVRYEIGDLAQYSSDLCSCGRGLSLLKSIEGRSFDIIECPNGNRVAGTFWTICLRRYEGVVQFQVIQNSTNQLVLNLIVDDEYDRKSENNIRADIRDKCGKEMLILFNYTDQIELTRSGKQKLVVKNINGV